jgi:hypothetical protein
MAFIYSAPENHVELRACLSPALRKDMFHIPRDRWVYHPGFSGEAEFWTQIHEGLLSASSTLVAWSEKALAADDLAGLAQLSPQISSLGRRIVHHAHQHHHIEDDFFFPVFLKAFPQLAHPLELLDSDHKVLAEVLDGLEKAVADFPLAPDGSERQRRDAWLAGAERLLPAARRLDTLFKRHIGDEEEICIPAMLQG